MFPRHMPRPTVVDPMCDISLTIVDVVRVIDIEFATSRSNFLLLEDGSPFVLLQEDGIKAINL